MIVSYYLATRQWLLCNVTYVAWSLSTDWIFAHDHHSTTVHPKKYAHGFCFAVLCCGYTLTDFPISIRLTSLALWQSNDCPSASKATLMNTDKYLMWIHYERLHNHNKAKHNKTVCIFLGIYCSMLCTTADIRFTCTMRFTCTNKNQVCSIKMLPLSIVKQLHSLTSPNGYCTKLYSPIKWHFSLGFHLTLIKKNNRNLFPDSDYTRGTRIELANSVNLRFDFYIILLTYFIYCIESADLAIQNWICLIYTHMYIYTYKVYMYIVDTHATRYLHLWLLDISMVFLFNICPMKWDGVIHLLSNFWQNTNWNITPHLDVKSWGLHVANGGLAKLLSILCYG